MTLQIALLARAQALVKQDFGCAMLLRQELDLIRLARTYEQGSVGSAAFACDTGYGSEPGSLGQQAQFLQLGIKVGHT
jgi:hypothetical protein